MLSFTIRCVGPAAAAVAFLVALAPINAAATQSEPQPLPISDTIPAPQDTAYPGGTIRLSVDATDIVRGIFTVDETIPIATSGATTLLFPKWLPGHHSPTGQVSMMAGLVIRANGVPVPWRRDPVDMFAFHLDVPAGVQSLSAHFQYLSPTSAAQGRIVTTPEMLSLQWDSVALYPAGYFTRQIPFEATATFPKGWHSATALAPGLSGDHITYPIVDFETLIDSPVIAGRFMRSDVLAPGVRLDIAADREEQLDATPAQIDAHRRLVEQTIKLFGAQHYDHYDFLLTLSANLGEIGLEHHRSSEDGATPDYFLKWDENAPARNLLPHEFTHSWNGKFRRPADLWTPNYSVPMRDSLLWVYEGQTQYWGFVLQARSGLVSKQDTLDALASTAAYYSTMAGRTWRPLEDTTNDPIISRRAPQGWRSYQRSEDYYSEGQLIWLEADQLIREKTGGKKSLDDFARNFFGMRDRDWGVLTYQFDDVVRALNDVMPYDWVSFLHDHVSEVRPNAPLDWISRGGYKLVWTDTPSPYLRSSEATRNVTDLSYSLGLTLTKDASISAVAWGGPAFDGRITVGAKLLAVDGKEYDADMLRSRIRAVKGTAIPIHLLIKQGSEYRDVSVQWNGGLRYPRLEKVGKSEAGLDKLLAPRP